MRAAVRVKLISAAPKFVMLSPLVLKLTFVPLVLGKAATYKAKQLNKCHFLVIKQQISTIALQNIFYSLQNISFYL